MNSHKKNRKCSNLIHLSVASAFLASCGTPDNLPGTVSDEVQSRVDEFGEVGLRFAMLHDLDLKRIEFEFSHPGKGLLKEGGFDIGNPHEMRMMVLRLPEGDGNRVSVRAFDSEGVVRCTSSSEFRVDAGVTTEVNLVLTCNLPGNSDSDLGDVNLGIGLPEGELTECPNIHSVAVAPLPTYPGASVNLCGSATPTNLQDDLSFAWRYRESTISSESRANWTCPEEGGAHTLTFQASDSDCTRSFDVVVDCPAAGVDDSGTESGDESDAEDGDASNDSHGETESDEVDSDSQDDAKSPETAGDEPSPDTEGQPEPEGADSTGDGADSDGPSSDAGDLPESDDVGSSGGEPNDDQPAGEQSGGDDSADDNSAGEESAGDDSGSAEPGGEASAGDESASDESCGEQTGGDQADSEVESADVNTEGAFDLESGIKAECGVEDESSPARVNATYAAIKRSSELFVSPNRVRAVLR